MRTPEHINPSSDRFSLGEPSMQALKLSSQACCAGICHFLRSGLFGSIRLSNTVFRREPMRLCLCLVYVKYLMLYGSPIKWCSRRQQTTAASTMEAEYEAITGVVWLRSLLGNKQNLSTPLLIDNQAAIRGRQSLYSRKVQAHRYKTPQYPRAR